MYNSSSHGNHQLSLSLPLGFMVVSPLHDGTRSRPGSPLLILLIVLIDEGRLPASLGGGGDSLTVRVSIAVHHQGAQARCRHQRG